VCLVNGGEINPPAVGLSIIDHVVEDPCDPSLGGRPLSGDAREVAAAISNLDGFQVTKPVSVSLGGVPGLRFTVTAPTENPCSSLSTWATAARVNGVSAGETNEVTVLVVDGKALLIAAAYQVSASMSDVVQLRAVVESVQFELER